MDLKLFFSPIHEEIFDDISSVSSFFKNINVFGGLMPDLQGHTVALIGLNDNRGSGDAGSLETSPDEIRKKLYQLKKGQGQYKIIDLGNLNVGVDLEETYNRIKEVGEYLMINNVLPIFFGGTHDLDIGQYRAYEGLEKLVTFLNIDAKLDMDEEAAPDSDHIQKILLHNPNYLFHYGHLAYQSYLIESRTVEVLERLYFETYRVGHLRSNMEEMEPIIRNADLMSFDISSIKSIDAPGTQNRQPFGLTGEEACQIAWYAGLNDKLSSIGFYGYDPEKDDNDMKTASIVATMIWYFIEGFNNRKDHTEFKTNDYMKYTVSIASDPGTLVFFKSLMSEKWWMEVPYPDGKDKYQRNCMVPCSYSDYEIANSGELPERYITTHAKLI